MAPVSIVKFVWRRSSCDISTSSIVSPPAAAAVRWWLTGRRRSFRSPGRRLLQRVLRFLLSLIGSLTRRRQIGVSGSNKTSFRLSFRIENIPRCDTPRRHVDDELELELQQGSTCRGRVCLPV